MRQFVIGDRVQYNSSYTITLTWHIQMISESDLPPQNKSPATAGNCTTRVGLAGTAEDADRMPTPRTTHSHYRLSCLRREDRRRTVAVFRNCRWYQKTAVGQSNSRAVRVLSQSQNGTPRFDMKTDMSPSPITMHSKQVPTAIISRRKKENKPVCDSYCKHRYCLSFVWIASGAAWRLLE